MSGLSHNYPSSYQELAELGEYLENQGQIVEAFVSKQIKELSVSLSRMKSVPTCEKDVEDWLRKFADLNLVFLIKYLELIFGICSPNQVASETKKQMYIQKSAAADLPYHDSWMKRIVLTLGSSEDFLFSYSKRCFCYSELWGLTEYKNVFRELKFLVSRLTTDCFVAFGLQTITFCISEKMLP